MDIGGRGLYGCGYGSVGEFGGSKNRNCLAPRRPMNWNLSSLKV